MGDMTWGLLGRESVGSERRTRTLGLGAAVRNFNEMAVPGMGGVWFARQLYLASLGVAVNELARSRGARTSNIEVSNALEAMGCWHAFRKTDRQDARLRGREKLPREDVALDFATFSRPSFYVTQPMRMQTVQAVRALGLVQSTGERFNSYQMTAAGHEFLACAFRTFTSPHNRQHLVALADWVCGDDRMKTEAIHQLLSPAEPLPQAACEQLRDLLVRGGSEAALRRRNLLAWCDDLRQGALGPADRPPQLGETHWHEVQAGRLFFALQDAAFAVLNAVEAMVARSEQRSVALADLHQAPVHLAIKALREAAAAYQAHGYQDLLVTGASRFALECAETSDARVIAHLVARDGRVLRLSDGKVVPGVAFLETAEIAAGVDDEQPAADEADVPLGLSHRINNFYLLNLDLNGLLATKLEREMEERHE